VTEASALETLLKYSPKCAYVPKPKGDAKSDPISLDAATREKAYAALLVDLQADGAEKMKAISRSKTLPNIKAALIKYEEMAPVEKVVTKSDDDAQKQIDDLVNQASTLMDDAAKKAADQIAMLTENANISIMSGIIGVGGAPRKRGLVGSEPKDVKAAMATCNQLQAAAKDFAASSKKHATEFNAIATAADATAKDGYKLLQQFHAVDR